MLLRNIGQCLAHPITFFEDIQEPGKVRIWHAFLLVVLAAAARMYTLMYTGFSFSGVEPWMVNVPREINFILMPWISWAVCNWAVSAIMDGEGRFRDILISTAYIYVPYILFMPLLTSLTNLLTEAEKSLYLTLFWGTFVWMAFLLIQKVRIVHDYSLGKTFGTIVLTVFGMAVLWFILLLLLGIVNQALQFFYAVYKEIVFRL